MQDLNDTAKYCKAPTMLFMDDTDYEMPHDFRFKNYPDFTDFEPKLWSAQWNEYVAPPALASLTQLAYASPTSRATKRTRSGLKAIEDSNKDTNNNNILPHRRRRSYSSSSSSATSSHLAKRAEALANHLPHFKITTSDPIHSARLACSSAGYRGPDIVSLHEKMFCDYETKTLWPLCPLLPNTIQDLKKAIEGEGTSECFDVLKGALVQEGKVYKRTYRRSEIWELNGDIVVDGVVINRPR